MEGEVQAQAIAIALAVNAPDKLSEAFKPTASSEVPEVGQKWWKRNE